VDGECSSGDGFHALHCSRFNWVASSVCLCGCSGWRFLPGRLRDEVGGLRVDLVGAGWGGGVVLSGVVADLAFFFGFWVGFFELGLSRLEVGLARFF